MIALGSDHGGYLYKEELKKHLDEKGIEYNDAAAMCNLAYLYERGLGCNQDYPKAIKNYKAQ